MKSYNKFIQPIFESLQPLTMDMVYSEILDTYGEHNEKYKNDIYQNCQITGPENTILKDGYEYVYGLNKNKDVYNIRFVTIPTWLWDKICQGKQPTSTSFTSFVMMTSEWLLSKGEQLVCWRVHELGHQCRNSGIKQINLKHIFDRNKVSYDYPNVDFEYTGFYYQIKFLKFVKQFTKVQVTELMEQSYTGKLVTWNCLNKGTGWSEHKKKCFEVYYDLVDGNY